MIIKIAGVVLLALITLTGAVHAGSARELNADVSTTLERFYVHTRGGRELVGRAHGVLVFPSIIKAGLGLGGEYGEGALRINGQTEGFYNTVSASIGFQLGVEERSVVILFMTEEALYKFRQTNGWKAGVDASVAILKLGAGGEIDTNKVANPVLGFILDPKGLMYNLTLEGSKISRISK